MSQPAPNYPPAEDLLAHCETTVKADMVAKLREGGFPESHPLYGFMVSTIGMAAASGGREMFVELGRRGLLVPPRSGGEG